MLIGDIAENAECEGDVVWICGDCVISEYVYGDEGVVAVEYKAEKVNCLWSANGDENERLDEDVEFFF